jgi:hypothetical protein
MGEIQPLNKSVDIILGGTGGGTARIGPSFGPPVWHVTNSQVRTSSPGQGNIPLCTLYRGTQDSNGYIDTTYDGSADSCDIPYDLVQGSQAIAVWSGGNPGDVATLTLIGTTET